MAMLTLQALIQATSLAQQNAAAAYLQRGGLLAVLDLLQSPVITAILKQVPHMAALGMDLPQLCMCPPTAVQTAPPRALPASFCHASAGCSMITCPQQPAPLLLQAMPPVASPPHMPLPLLRPVSLPAYAMPTAMPALGFDSMSVPVPSMLEMRPMYLSSPVPTGTPASASGSASTTLPAEPARCSDDGSEEQAALRACLAELAFEYFRQDQPYGTRSIEGLIRHCLLSSHR